MHFDAKMALSAAIYKTMCRRREGGTAVGGKEDKINQRTTRSAKELGGSIPKRTTRSAKEHKAPRNWMEGGKGKGGKGKGERGKGGKGDGQLQNSKTRRWLRPYREPHTYTRMSLKRDDACVRAATKKALSAARYKTMCRRLGGGREQHEARRNWVAAYQKEQRKARRNIKRPGIGWKGERGNGEEETVI